MKRYALIIGIDQYPDAPLNYCCRDAKAMRDVLNKDFDEIILLTNQEATRNNICDAISKLLNKMLTEDIFLLHFSGHGITKNDSPGIIAYDDFISRGDIRRLTNKISIKRLFILDCCRYGDYIRKSTYSYIPSIIPENFPLLLPPIILSACCSGQIAREDSNLQHGIFTKKILDILQNRQVNDFAYFLQKLDTIKNSEQDFEQIKPSGIDIALLKSWKTKHGLTTTKYFPENPELYAELYSKRSYANAFDALCAAANGKNADAQYYLAFCFFENENYEQYWRWIKQAVDQGHYEAKYLWAKSLFCNNHCDIAFPIFKELAECKDADAQYYLGLCYRDGLGTQVNRKYSFQWMKKAADGDNIEAVKTLIHFYQEGIGCTKDNLKAQQYRIKYTMLQTKKIGEDILNSPRYFFDNTISQANTIAKSILNQASSIAKDSLKAASSIAKDAQELLKETTDQTKNVAKDTLKNTIKHANSIAQETQELLKEKTDQTKNVAKDTLKNTIKQVDIIASATQGLLKDKINQTKSWVNKKMNK